MWSLVNILRFFHSVFVFWLRVYFLLTKELCCYLKLFIPCFESNMPKWTTKRGKNWNISRYPPSNFPVNSLNMRKNFNIDKWVNNACYTYKYLTLDSVNTNLPLTKTLIPHKYRRMYLSQPLKAISFERKVMLDIKKVPIFHWNFVTLLSYLVQLSTLTGYWI